ncbi:hypothetical protein CGC20_4510 [Leishmania donovani]|uniref:Uncharacterized protein n=1 Tax=Leishmania donovani TaxID=5661 RepID=A0A504XT52_LEIDO|nr:hypothetical protein CGC20_4510 [Leishmania donovani]
MPSPNSWCGRGSSAASLDLYPGGFWNALARVPAAAAVNGARASRPSSVVSLGTADNLSTPRSGAGLWNRLLGGSGRTQTPPHTPSFSPAPHTGLTTTTPGGGSGMWGGFSPTPITAHSNASTPLRDACQLLSSSSPTQNGSVNGGRPSQRSSSSEFDIL